VSRFFAYFKPICQAAGKSDPLTRPAEFTQGAMLFILANLADMIRRSSINLSHQHHEENAFAIPLQT